MKNPPANSSSSTQMPAPVPRQTSLQIPPGRHDGKEPRPFNRKPFLIVIAIVAITLVAWAVFSAVNAATDAAGYKGRLEQISADPSDIERRWLVDSSNLPYDLKTADDKSEIEQFYIAWSPEVRIRCYDNGSSYDMTVKNNISEDGISRDETIIDVTSEQYEQLVLRKDANTIRKTRYMFYDAGQVISLDVFHGQLDGLAIASVDFASDKEAADFQPFSWMSEEVTADSRYLNSGLARWGMPSEPEDEPVDAE